GAYHPEYCPRARVDHTDALHGDGRHDDRHHRCRRSGVRMGVAPVGKRRRGRCSSRDAKKMMASEYSDRQTLSRAQADRLSRLIAALYGENRFYTRKFDDAGIRPGALRFPDDLERLPTTSKKELVADQAASPPWGTALTEPIEHYTRYNQTSSTTGNPVR